MANHRQILDSRRPHHLPNLQLFRTIDKTESCVAEQGLPFGTIRAAEAYARTLSLPKRYETNRCR